MSKSQEIRKLLEDNRNILLNGEENNGICFDGIVNEAEYSNIVVLLKETNGCDANGNMPEKFDDWDYCKWLKDQQADNKPEKKIGKNGKEYIEENVFYHSTFRKLCHWLCLLFDSLENEKSAPENFSKNGQVDIDKVRKVLNRVAVVNLKKSWGDKQTDTKSLEAYLSNPAIKDVLTEQMKILNPKIVLCCSPDVYWLATLVYAKDSSFTYRQSSESINGKNVEFVHTGGTIYINFYHPQYYGKTDEQFTAYAVEVFEHLKKYIENNNL